MRVELPTEAFRLGRLWCDTLVSIQKANALIAFRLSFVSLASLLAGQSLQKITVHKVHKLAQVVRAKVIDKLHSVMMLPKYFVTREKN